MVDLFKKLHMTDSVKGFAENVSTSFDWSCCYVQQAGDHNYNF